MATKAYTVQPSRRIVKDPNLQQALDDIHNTILPHVRANSVNTLTYGPSVTPNLALGNIQTLSVTDSQPFTVQAPIGVAVGNTAASKHAQIQPNAHWTLVMTNDMVVTGNDGVMRPSFDSSIVVSAFTSPGRGGAAVAQFVTIIKGTTVKHYQVGAWSTR